jgi:hypothetical protein
MVRIFDRPLHVHYGQAYLESSGNTEGMSLKGCFIGQANGLCGAASPGTLFLLTGLHTGCVNFTLDVLDSAPPLDESWEEIIEVSFTPRSDKTVLSEWGGESVCDVPLLQKSYRVRYCARDMDRGGEIDTIVDEDPVDSYALIFWQADPAPDVIIKQTSDCATYWHNEIKRYEIKRYEIKRF